jgi:hypothetical protein
MISKEITNSLGSYPVDASEGRITSNYIRIEDKKQVRFSNYLRMPMIVHWQDLLGGSLVLEAVM